MSADFHLNNKETKPELKVNFNNETLSFCSEPKYLGVTLDRMLTYRRHLGSLRKMLTSRVAILRRLAASGYGVGSRNNFANSHLSPGLFNSRVSALLEGAVVLTPASLILSSMTPCKLWLDACVLHQRTIFLSLPASNLLSFVAKKPSYWRSQSKNWRAKCFILGEKHYFVWDTASQSTKWL